MRLTCPALAYEFLILMASLWSYLFVRVMKNRAPPRA